MLEVCLLGTGGTLPLPERRLTALLLRHRGRMILIDCGEGTQIPVKMVKWGIKAIDAILFTHYHADHVAGLPGLLLTLGNSGRTEPLVLMGPPGLKEVVKGLTVIAPELPYEITLIELSEPEKDGFNINGFYIKSLPVEHNIPCLSYCIELKRQGRFDVEKAGKLNIPLKYWKHLQKGEAVIVEGRVINPDMVMGKERKGIKVCYCTDTRPIGSLTEFIKDSDLFICEGMYGDDAEQGKAVQNKHMTFSEAGVLAGSGNVKELWLTHFSPSLTEPEKYIDSVRRIFSNTVIGNDMLSKEIKYGDE